MNILQKIKDHKLKEVAQRKSLYPSALLEKSVYFETKPLSMVEYLRRTDKSGIIAEFKRKSPSKGDINAYATVEQVSIGYMQAGASALSVLTDTEFFGGKNEDLIEARKYNYCPILRKDFILDEYQIMEAKSIGADVILLIGDMLSKEEVQRFSAFAKSLGLEVLMEVHDERPLDYLNPNIDMVGVNNRDLTNFEVDTKTSEKLAALIPKEFTKISESGINNPETVVKLKEFGFDGFLIGEQFMKSANPEKACHDFINQIKILTNE